MRQFSTRKLACGRAWRVSTEKWCVFSSEKFCGFFGQGVENEGGIARKWSCRSRVKWNSLFLVKPGQRINSGSAEGYWKHWIGSSEKMGVFSWFAPFRVWFFAPLVWKFSQGWIPKPQFVSTTEVWISAPDTKHLFFLVFRVSTADFGFSIGRRKVSDILLRCLSRESGSQHQLRIKSLPSPNPNFLVRLFSGGVGGLPREGVGPVGGPKSSVYASKPRETKLFGGRSRDFAGISRAPEKFAARSKRSHPIACVYEIAQEGTSSVSILAFDALARRKREAQEWFDQKICDFGAPSLHYFQWRAD